MVRINIKSVKLLEIVIIQPSSVKTGKQWWQWWYNRLKIFVVSGCVWVWENVVKSGWSVSGEDYHLHPVQCCLQQCLQSQCCKEELWRNADLQLWNDPLNNGEDNENDAAIDNKDLDAVYAFKRRSSYVVKIAESESGDDTEEDVVTHHQLSKLLVEFLFIRHGSGGSESLESQSSSSIVSHAVGDLWRIIRPGQAPAPASPPPHLGWQLSHSSLGLLHVAGLEAGELGLQTVDLVAQLAEVRFGKFGSMNLGETQTSEHFSQTGTREPVVQTFQLHIGERVQHLKILSY